MGEKRETFNKELRVQCLKKKAFDAENDAMINDREFFKVEREEMAIMPSPTSPTFKKRQASRG